MKKKYISFLLLTVFSASLITGCTDTQNSSSDVQAETSAFHETAPVIDVVEDGMTAVYGKDIKDGTYTVEVDSSSSMFKITDCKLTVSDGNMTAVMTMGGKGYLYMFMGTGEEAEKADSAEYISFEETADGSHTFTISVEALDSGIQCAAYSKNKESWYDRTLLVRADSLPPEAFNDGVLADVESLGLSDGVYNIEAALEGGSGRAEIQSPAKLTITDGKAFAEIAWNSSSYDYMSVNGEKYYPVNTDGNSVFEIPVTFFDYKMPVSADTTAMSTPYEIEYTIYFDSQTIEKQ